MLKDTNDFLLKLKDLGSVPHEMLLCTVDVVGLRTNILHRDGLEVKKKILEQKEDKIISTESRLHLTECVK